MAEVDKFNKTVAVIRDTSLNPSCPHGPTILFDRNGTRFFACSAFRSRKLCPFYLLEENWKSFEDDGSSNLSKIKKRKAQGVDTTNLSKKKLKQSSGLSKELSILPLPTQRDKGEAQYHFTDETVQFLIEQFQISNFDSILCIGTPSLHEYIRKNSATLKLKSFLLDIDQRLVEKYSPQEFALYNMCNHHFFAPNNEAYQQFLKKSFKLAVVTDPPFGVKVDLIWNSCLEGVKKDLKKLQNDDEVSCEILWIFPYFLEGHILSKCPESGLQMSDFKVAYKNHKKFSGKSSKSSPVRVYTTIPLAELKLPEDSYRFCGSCQKWVDKNNKHCPLCKVCTTKDGGKTYVHCKRCKKCVKPTWIHCESPCGTCHLETQDCEVSKRGRKQKTIKRLSPKAPKKLITPEGPKKENTPKGPKDRKAKLPKQKRQGNKNVKK